MAIDFKYNQKIFPLSYPYIGIVKSVNNFYAYVLFYKPSTGMVIASNYADKPVGTLRTDWIETNFDVMTGTLELSNYITTENK